MKKSFALTTVACCLTSAVLFSGCGYFKHFLPYAGRSSARPPVLPSIAPYSGPKAAIAVADFEVKTNKATNEIGSALRQQLVTTLIKSSRFLIISRPEEPAEAVFPGVSAGLIIAVSLVEFEPEASGGVDGVGGGGGVNSGIFGGLLGRSPNKAHLALEVRVVNAATSEVLAVTKVAGQAVDSETKGMEYAINVCTIEAVRYIIQAVKPEYYKYKEDSNGKT